MPAFEVRKVGGRIGAEVLGVDLATRLDDSTFRQVNDALVEHKVLVFRDQDIDDDAQLGFASRFGTLEEHPAMKAADGRPAITPVDGEDQRANHWHTDVSFTPTPPLGTTLRAVTLPPYGGDTLVANCAAGYKDLPAELREIADGLWTVHTNHAEQPRLGTERAEAYRSAFMSTRYETAHPLVRVHPDSGEPSLLLGGFAQWLVGMTTRESRPLLDVFASYVLRPENVLRWRWQLGDVLMFDNRSTQHYAPDDYDQHTRVLHRVSVNGDTVTGLDGKSSYWIRREAAA